jgi:hypothetical protein
MAILGHAQAGILLNVYARAAPKDMRSAMDMLIGLLEL